MVAQKRGQGRAFIGGSKRASGVGGQEDRPNAETRVALSMRLIPGRGRSNGISSNVKEERQDDNSIEYSVGSLVTYWGLITSMVAQ